MSARPFLLLGEADRRRLAEAVQGALAAWRHDWLAEGAPQPAASPAGTPPLAERWLAVQGPAGPQLLLGCAPGWLAHLGGLLAGQQPEPPQGAPALALRVAEAALEALARGVLGAFSAPAGETRWDSESVPAAWLEPGAGCALYDLAPALPLVLALSPALAAGSLPKPAPHARREPLAALPGTLESSPVRLEAVVGEAEIELGELARLAAGDVLVLERRLDEPLALRLGTRAVARVYLGTTGEARAVQLAARPHN